MTDRRRRQAAPGSGGTPRIEAHRSPTITGLLDRVRGAPYAALAMGVLAVAAYLCLVNLDYAALWHDEAPAALIGRNLLQRGDISGWDGRNLVGGTNGRTLNDELRDVLPPLTYVINAAGMAVFGINETGARSMPALLGIATLGLLYLLLRQHLAEHPRLILWCLLFAAWSPQLLLYFRQSRYYAFLAFGMIAAFYLYERWWRSGNARYLVGLTLVAALAFFNHYVGGAATMLALATWHLLYRARATAPRQWLALVGSGLLVVALGTAYLAWLGVLGGERSGFLAFTGVAGIGEYQGTTPLILLRIGIYVRELFTADWISWPVLLWFAGMSALAFVRRRRRIRTTRQADGQGRSSGNKSAAQVAEREDAPGAPPGGGRRALPLAAAGTIVLMGVLFALFSAAMSVQPVWVNPTADLRYYMGALPLLLAMKGLFAEWAWRRSKLAGAAAIAVLLFSSAGAWPFNVTNYYTGKPTLGLHLLQFVGEIHRPYRDSIRVVSDYLLEHAEQDDLVYVPGFADREALTFTAGHRVLFCCGLNQDSPLPRATVEALGAPLYYGQHVPDWIVILGGRTGAYLERAKEYYVVAAQPDVFFYPTQRPEINMHLFTPLPAGPGPGFWGNVYILRRKESGGLYQAAETRMRQQRYGEALAAYRAALELDPAYAPAHGGAGVALFQLRRYEEALAALAQALALQPDAPYAGRLQRLMGRAVLKLGHPEAAAAHFERALQLDSEDAAGLHLLATVRFGQRRYQTALDLYRRLLAIAPDNAQTHAHIGAAQYHLGRNDAAVRSLEHALSLDPALETARTTLDQLRRITPEPGP